jgi:cyanophycin synthetase
VPGDRRDEDIREAGRLCARFDRVIIKEDANRRGRAPGAIAALLMQGLRAGGLDPSRVDIADNEIEGIHRGLDLVGDDDLLVVHANKVPQTLAIVRERAALTA